MTDLNIAIEDQNRLAELIGDWTQNQYLTENYVTMNIVDAIIIAVVLMVLALAVVSVLHMVCLDGSKLENKAYEYHLRRIVEQYKKENPEAENYTWNEKNEACERAARTMRMISLAILLIATAAIIVAVGWALTVYGPMQLEAESLNLEAQMQAILDRQTGPDAITLEEYLSKYA